MANELNLGSFIPHIVNQYGQLGVETEFFNCIVQKWRKLKNKNLILSWPTLHKHSFTQEELDFLAYEFCKKMPTCHIVIIWQKAIPNSTYIIQELNNSGRIIYSRKVHLKGKALPYLIQTIPEKAPNIPLHLQYYFDNQPQTELEIVLCIFADLKSAVDCKKRIRNQLKLNPPISALHISDDQKQSIDLAQIFFNKNTIKYLNAGLYPSHFEKFNFLFQKYRSIIAGFPFNKDYCCVDGSSILALHGIRDINVDFDFLSCMHDVPISGQKYPFKQMSLGPLDLHNKAWVRSGVDPIETIFNPQFHFYYQGIKCTTLERIRYFKFCQDREVDRKDIARIDPVLKTLSNT